MNARPKKGDMSDKRCAFVADRPGKHDLGKDPDEMWCSGCGFYLCESCDDNMQPFGAHDVIEHEDHDE